MKINNTIISRRDFVKLTVAAGVAAGSSSVWAGETKGDMPYRKLGRTGEKVSLIGLGGFHIGKQADENDSIRIIRSAIDRGVNFMDNSWDYNNGNSEIRMGKALRDGYRDKVFLMTKFDGRTKQRALEQLDESLQRLQADHLDLWQFHENIRMDDPDRFFAADGAVEAVLEAKKAGKIRFAGFTGHKAPEVHLRMLEMADAHKFRFDAVQMPLNVMDAHFRSFGKNVLPVLVKKKIGVLGMKPLGSGVILSTKVVSPIECLHYAMNLPTSVVLTGMDKMEILEQALEAARTFKPMTSAAVAELLARTATLAADGKYEPFKTTSGFDATSRNPKWLS